MISISLKSNLKYCSAYFKFPNFVSVLPAIKTNTTGVAETPRDASSLWTVQYLERSLLLSGTSSSDLQMRTIKFCVLFSSAY